MGKSQQSEFFDKDFSEHTRESVSKFYSITDSIRDFYRGYLRRHVPGQRVLEYGCGQGSFAFYVAEQGARDVVGIDISEVGIQQAAQKAAELQLDNLTFLVMDGEVMEFDDSSFGVVCGAAILHHVDLTVALPEIVRVLEKDGKAIFIEPMGYNPAINLFRKRTPDYRVEDEHPFKKADFDILARHFGSVEAHFYYLFTLLAVPFQRFSFFSRLIDLLDWVDQFLFKIIPGLKYLAWQVAIIAEKPVK